MEEENNLVDTLRKYLVQVEQLNKDCYSLKSILKDVLIAAGSECGWKLRLEILTAYPDIYIMESTSGRLVVIQKYEDHSGNLYVKGNGK